ncbi:Hsp70-like protein [Phytophthora palmivora]|uniref:Hsp70-like protein n=1 Tax=Phytophthora palmivora TaxID=4796 RepID=A0A2P4XAF4_9STRA|nr:Hsp70-like protein [Phytophthora palmivora]
MIESAAKQVDQGGNGNLCAEDIEPSDVKAELLGLMYVAASSEDLSCVDLRVHTREGWDVHMESTSKLLFGKLQHIYSNGKLILYATGRRFQVPAAPLDEHPAVPTNTAESVGLNLEGLFFLMLPKELWILIA